MLEVTPRIGSYVQPDAWKHGEKLVASDWDQAQFRIPTGIRAGGAFTMTPSGYVEIAINVEVTGRTWQRAPYTGTLRVRCRIEFVGDGEPSSFSGGWLYAD